MCSWEHYETPALNPATQMLRILYFGSVINLLLNFSHVTRFLSDVVVHLVSDNQLIIFYLNVFLFFVDEPGGQRSAGAPSPSLRCSVSLGETGQVQSATEDRGGIREGCKVRWREIPQPSIVN